MCDDRCRQECNCEKRHHLEDKERRKRCQQVRTTLVSPNPEAGGLMLVSIAFCCAKSALRCAIIAVCSAPIAACKDSTATAWVPGDHRRLQ